MSKKFLQVDDTGRVMLIHNMPFDAVNGMGKTKDELLQMGVLVDEVPEPERIDGKIPLPYYTAEHGLYYEYEDAPPEPASTKDIEELRAQIDYVGMMTEVL